MKNILFLICIVLFIGCKTEELQPVNTLYGVLMNYNGPYQDSKAADSIVSIDLSSKKSLRVANAKAFPGLGDIKLYARSIKKNVYIYKSSIALSDIGLIDLPGLKYNSIALNNDNISNVLALHVDELENMIYAIIISYNENTRSNWLGLLPLDLSTKKSNQKIDIKEIDTQYIQNILTYTLIASEIDYTNKRIFIKLPVTNELIIYNYKSKEIQTREMKQTMFDLHYNSNTKCLFGSGDSEGFGLFEYSLIDNVTKRIGSYSNIELIAQNSFYYDKLENSYWISAYMNYDIYGKLYKINMSDASVKDSMTINGPFLLHKRIDYIN